MSHFPESAGDELQLEGDSIVCRSKYFGDWTLPLSDVLAIGEATADPDLAPEDWYFAFATGDGRWIDGPIYGAQIGEFLDSLRDRFQCDINLRLVGSTTFASRVIWPPNLVDRPMFTYVPKKPGGWLGRIWPNWLTLRNTQFIHPDLWDVLGAPPSSELPSQHRI